MRTALLFALSLACAGSIFAQYNLLPADDWNPVMIKDGLEQVLLKSGGLNNPQLRSVDLDGDGRLDYYVFDRAGDVHLAFACDASGKLVDKSALTRSWPKVDHFSLLRDYNQDGVPDLFVSSSESGREGIWVYTGFRQNSELRFELANFPGRLMTQLGYKTPAGDQLIYVARTDVPAIEDVDGDGDLDILSFDPTGGYIYFYRNISTGSGSNPENHLKFELASTCYGGVYENNFDSQLLLASVAGGCGNPLKQPSTDPETAERGIHPGSTLTPTDLDGDGDLDMLIGDINTDQIARLINSPVNGVAFYTAISYAWPTLFGATPVDLEFFPAVYPIAAKSCKDVNTCTQRDFIVSPSNPGGGEDYYALWYYEQQAGQAQNLQLVQKDFLTELAFDHGTGSHIAIGQLDGLGGDDLLVGNESIYTPGAPSNKLSSLRYYACGADGRCVESRPNWLNQINQTLSSQVISLDPVLADMDSDGDLDLLIGNSGGGISYAENLTSAGGPVTFGALDAVYQGINVGLQSSPAVGDVNGDGLPDLLIGERAGNINLFLNRGTATAPAFASTADDEFYGGIDVRLQGFNGSASSRPAVANVQGQQVLYVGSAQGRMLVYTQLPSGANGTAKLWGELQTRAGDLLDPVVGIDRAKNLPLVLVGNQRGGLSAFRIEATLAAEDKAGESLNLLSIYPNPNSGRFRIANLRPRSQVDIYDMLGRVVFQAEVEGEEITSHLAPGMYVVVVREAGQRGQRVMKLVVE